MNHTYETMLLLDNREVKKGWDALKSHVTGLFTKHGSEVVSARRWDERRLAYPINGQQRATYLLMYHHSPTASIPAINRDLQYAEPVLRSLTLVCEQVPEEAHKPEDAFDESAVPIDDEPMAKAAEQPAAESREAVATASARDAEASTDQGEKSSDESAKADEDANEETER